MDTKKLIYIGIGIAIICAIIFLAFYFGKADIITPPIMDHSAASPV